jgi:acyl-CoA synthetase (AMP-forming)/AMP-acid ligase II
MAGQYPVADHHSLVEPLLERIARRPDELALTLIEDNGSEQKVSVGELNARAASIARALAGEGLEPGDIVILALRHSLDLIAGLWGVLYAGGIPSIFPYLPPEPNVEKIGQQLRMLVSGSGAGALLTLPEFRDSLAEDLASLGCRVTAPQAMLRDSGRSLSDIPLRFTSGEEIAYLQYTSGTTGLQKGVLLSHRAILHCVQAYARALDLKDTDVVVNWLPLYHDYGLFAGLMLSLLTGIPAVLMSPFKWVRNPKSLLWAIHRHRGTLSWMPNSAYSHAVHSVRTEDLAGLDLGSLRCLGSAAEPVMRRTQQDFLERFAPFGFRETALMTGYGMAENSMAITVSPVGRRAPIDWVEARALQTERFARPATPGDPGAIPIVSCGSAVEGTDIVIADDRGRPVPERGVGEITIRTASLFSGYHRRPDLTALAFRDGWFLTGDLGYLAGGQLYVCGRKKDLIIQAGHNIHPEDIEAVTASVPGSASGQVVAFGVPDERLGTEKIVLVCDLRRRADEAEKVSLERELRRRVFEELGVTLGEVYLMEKTWIVKTHNGKITRGANRQKYVSEIQKGT